MTQKNRTSKKSPPKTNPWVKAAAGAGLTVVLVAASQGAFTPTSEFQQSYENQHPSADKIIAGENAELIASRKATPGQKAAQAAYDAGWRGSDLVTMIAIADQESDFRSIDNSGLNRNGSVDYGVWQINKRSHASLFKKYNWKSVGDNARMAKIVFDEKHNGKRRGFSAWSSYNSGAYKNNLSTARTLAAGVKVK